MGRFLAVALLVGTAAGSSLYPKGYKSSKPYLPREHVIKSPTGVELVGDKDLPNNFDWREVDGVSYVTDSWNQHIPQYCGACWIHGTLSTLNDRVKVSRKAKFPDIRFGRQGITNCVPDPRGGEHPPPGCNGGDSYMIHKYLETNPMPDDTCLPYQAKNMPCEPENICRNCLPNGTCWAVKNYQSYQVVEYGNVSGEVNIMKEIYARGPVACSFAATDVFMLKYGPIASANEDVFWYNVSLRQDEIDHVMEVTGWGETASGQKYWVLRNSWGTYWGQMGWAKIRRGENFLLGEQECDWAVVKPIGLDETLKGEWMGDYHDGAKPVPKGEALSARMRSQKAPEMTAPGLSMREAAAPVLAADAPDAPLGPRDVYVFALGVAVTLGVVRFTGRNAVRQPTLLG